MTLTIIRKTQMFDITKVVIPNIITFIAITFTDIEVVMKVALFLISFGYACWKWITNYMDRKKKAEEDE
jgi:hypothetical protein